METLKLVQWKVHTPACHGHTQTQTSFLDSEIGGYHLTAEKDTSLREHNRYQSLRKDFKKYLEE